MASLGIFLALGACLHAGDLTYLPRNEDVQMVSSGKGVVLTEHYCDAAQELIRRTQECQDCVLRKTRCPNCCLASPSANRPYEAIRCARIGDPFGVDPRVACTAGSRFDGACPQASLSVSDQAIFNDCGRISEIPHAQSRGCPGLEPSLNSDPVVPLFTGCGSYFSSFEGGHFDVATSQTGEVASAEPTEKYRDFVDACRQDADARESCEKRVRCCKTEVCGSGGYDANCVDMECKTRVQAWERANKRVKTVDRGSLECWELTNSDCLRLNEEAQNCLNDVAGGTCGGCFLRIYADDSFNYRFVAKSNEKVVLLWKLYTTSTGDSSQTDYFYSKIQVEDAKREIIYTSPVHQKVFQGSFGVFSAISVPPELLKTGEEYFARLYYFINEDPKLKLRMDVTGAEIVAIRVRE
ncbi:MAG: hypothetical protein WC728_05980 [Elusimicrobiota bacterium]